MTQPLVRVISDRAADGGQSYQRGQTFAISEWPAAHLGGEVEPVNEFAERVFAYWRKCRNDRGFPMRPVDEAGNYFLPANIGFGFRPDEVAPVERSAEPGMPQYLLTAARRFGGWRHKAGATVTFLSWPLLCMEPANEPARLIVEYLARYAEHPRRLRSPWCVMRASLYLPQLEAADPGLPARIVSRPKAGPKPSRRTQHGGTEPRVSAA